MPHKKGKPKNPIIPRDISTPKTPRYLGIPNLEGSHMAWRFSNADINGPYSCGSFDLTDFQLLWDKLRSFERMNIAQLRSQGSYHALEPVKASRDAKSRLRALQLDDVTMLHSFRIQRKCRLWCMQHENIMSILWWDRNHKVYLVEK